MQEYTSYTSNWKPKSMEEFKLEKVVERQQVEIIETEKIEQTSAVEIAL